MRGRRGLSLEYDESSSDEQMKVTEGRKAVEIGGWTGGDATKGVVVVL